MLHDSNSNLFDINYRKTNYLGSMQSIQCHNCRSNKRQFYIYLECKHFICMNCCLFTANLQNFSLRCCYVNTKMQQQLIEIVLDQVKKRKIPYQLKNQETQIMQSGDQNKPIKSKVKSQHIKHKDSPIDQRKIEQQLYRTNLISKQNNPMSKLCTNTIFTNDTDQSPSFKYIKSQSLQASFRVKNQVSNGKTKVFEKQIDSIQQKIEKQNSPYYDNKLSKLNDRIIAKLTFHQQKMNRRILQHYLEQN